MRKFCIFLRLWTAATIAPIYSQETYSQEESEVPAFEESMLAPDEEDETPIPGFAASSSAKAAQSTTTWNNWIVAAGALVAAAVGVIVVSTNSDSAADHE